MSFRKHTSIWAAIRSETRFLSSRYLMQELQGLHPQRILMAFHSHRPHRYWTSSPWTDLTQICWVLFCFVKPPSWNASLPFHWWSHSTVPSSAYWNGSDHHPSTIILICNQRLSWWTRLFHINLCIVVSLDALYQIATHYKKIPCVAKYQQTTRELVSKISANQ